MLSAYVRAATHRAKYEILAADASFYGEIEGLPGVYANAAGLEACRDELEEVLEAWILVRVANRLPLPTVDGIDLAIRESA